MSDFAPMMPMGGAQPTPVQPEFPLAESLSLLQDDQGEAPPPPPSYQPSRSSRALQQELALNANPEDPDLVQVLRRQRPGIPPRMQQLLQKSDATQVSSWLTRDDPVPAAKLQVALEELAARHPQGWTGAQSDIARLDHAAQTGRLSDKAQTAWNRLLSGEIDEDLFASVISAGDVLDADVGDDLGVGPFGTVARVDTANGSAAVVVEYPIAPSIEHINFDMLAEQADDRVGKLLALAGDESIEEFDEVEVAQAVFGSSKLTETPKAARFAINDLLDRFGDPEEVKKALVAGWRKTRQIGDVDMPDGDGPNMLSAAISGALHPLASVRPTGLSEAALTASGPDLGEIRTSDGQTAVVAPEGPETGRLLNHLYPALKGRDGKPRWLPIKPVMAKDPKRYTAAVTAPDAVVDEWLNSDLIDGHPLTQPGDRIVFEHDGTVPQWYGSSRRLGKVVSEQPELRIEPVDLSDWSEDRLLYDRNSPLRTHLFGMFVHIDGTADLQFGKTAEDLQEIADASGLPFVSNVGVYPEEAEIPDTVTVDGMSIRWRDYSDDAGDATITYKQGVTRERLELQPRPDQLASVAKSLMELGATNVSVYTTQPQVEGFERVSEHLVSDGVTTRSYRTRHHEVTDPAAGYVWVPAGSRGITPGDVAPPQTPYRNGSPNGTEMVVQSPLVVKVGDETVRTFTVDEYGFIPTPEGAVQEGAVVVRNTGQRVTISAPDGQLDAAVNAAHMVRRAGYGKRIVIQGESDWVFSE